MNYIEQFKKDNNLKDREVFNILITAYDKIDDKRFIFDGNYIKDEKTDNGNYDNLLLELLRGNCKVLKPVILTELEYNLLEYWKSKGFDKFKTTKGKRYIRKQNTGNWYLIPQSLFNDLFKFSDEFKINDVLENCSINF